MRKHIIIAMACIATAGTASGALADTNENIFATRYPTPIIPSDMKIPKKYRADYLGEVGPVKSWLLTWRENNTPVHATISYANPQIAFSGHIFLGKQDITEAQIQRLGARLAAARNNEPEIMPLSIKLGPVIKKPEALTATDISADPENATNNSAHIDFGYQGPRITMIAQPMNERTRNLWRSIAPLEINGKIRLTVIPVGYSDEETDLIANMTSSDNPEKSWKTAMKTGTENQEQASDPKKSRLAGKKVETINNKTPGNLRLENDDLPAIMERTDDGNIRIIPYRDIPQALNALQPQTAEQNIASMEPAEETEKRAVTQAPEDAAPQPPSGGLRMPGNYISMPPPR